ncbi:Zinc finger protein, partial [Thalictrum thalictroides]
MGEPKMKVNCQMCETDFHTASECPWVYSACKQPQCNGIPMLTTSTTSMNPCRKYLACQFNSCNGGWQWLDEAMVEAATTLKSPSKGCYECGDEDHWLNNSPWK